MKKDIFNIGLIVMIIGFIMWMTPIGRTPLNGGTVAGPFEIGGFFVFIVGLAITVYGVIAKRRT
jgi:hypothetical protein